MTPFERLVRRRNAMLRAERMLRAAIAEKDLVSMANILERAWEPLSEALAFAGDPSERAEVIALAERILRNGQEGGEAVRLRLLIKMHDVVAEGGGDAFYLRLALSEVLRLQGNGDEAAIVAREALLCAGGDKWKRSEALLSLIDSLLDGSDVKEAARWHQLRGRDPKDLRWFLQGAIIAAHLGKEEEAEEFLNEANLMSLQILNDEDCPRVKFYKTKGDVLLVLGKLSDAATSYDLALAAATRAQSDPPRPVDLEKRIELLEVLLKVLQQIDPSRGEGVKHEINMLKARLAVMRGRHLRLV